MLKISNLICAISVILLFVSSSFAKNNDPRPNTQLSNSFYAEGSIGTGLLLGFHSEVSLNYKYGYARALFNSSEFVGGPGYSIGIQNSIQGDKNKAQFGLGVAQVHQIFRTESLEPLIEVNFYKYGILIDALALRGGLTFLGSSPILNIGIALSTKYFGR